MKRFFSSLFATLLFVGVSQAQSLLLLGAGTSGIPGWVPSKYQSADLYVNATHLNSDGTYCTGWFRKTSLVKPCSQFLTRTGTDGTALDASGNVVSFAGTALRATNAGLTTEEARTENIRNNSGSGGIIGSPGTDPTNWLASTASNGLTKQIVSFGTSFGLPTVTYRYFGTSTASFDITIQYDTGTTAGLTGQTWITNAFVSGTVNSGTIPTVGAELDELNTNTFLAGTQSALINLPATRTAITATRATNQATTNRVRGYTRVNITTGLAYDFNITVSGASLQQASFLTTPILTSSASVTRAQDFISFSDVSWLSQGQGTIYSGFIQEGNGAATATLFTVNDNTFNNRASNFMNTTSVFLGNVAVATATTNQISSSALTLGILHKGATAYALNDLGVGVDGVGGTRQTGAQAIPVFSAAHIGVSADATRSMSGTITELAYFSSSLSNSQLQAITQ